MTSSSDPSCCNCRSPRVQTHCELCQGALCKKCVQSPPKGAFAYWEECPEDLRFLNYCPSCYQEKVETAATQYEETLTRAKAAYVFFNSQKKAIPVLKKAKTKISIENQEDRDDTILKLAYRAAQDGYNALVECEVVSAKKRNEGFLHSVWSGSAYAASVDEEKMETRFR